MFSKNFSSFFFIFLLILFCNLKAYQTNKNAGGVGNIAALIDSLKQKINETEKFLEKAQEKIPKELVEEKEIKELAEENRQEVSDDWKKETLKDFLSNISFIQKVVEQGIIDEEELNDFKKRFDDLKKWIENTLDKVKYFGDDNYNALKHKKLSIRRVVKAQKKAYETLEKRSQELEMDETLQKRIKLLILYEINAEIQEKIKNGTVNELELGIPDKKIEEIVSKSIKQAKKAYKELSFDLAVIENLISTIKKIKEELEEQEIMLSKLEEMIKNKFKTKDKQILELEIMLRKEKQIAKAKRKKVEKEFKEKLKRVKISGLETELSQKLNQKEMELELEQKLQEKSKIFKEELEQKERANLELQLLLKEANKKIEHLQKKTNHLTPQLNRNSKNFIDEEKNKLNRLENKIRDIEEEKEKLMQT